mmetsp:Transcript_5764/g.13580  ORF Transcript_5764/g.13580 Transcript_5764/m.13580 type:complete len:281 (-) Transcript_5764:162-1004(-)
MACVLDHMQRSFHTPKRRRSRTKQTLQAPRRMERNAEQELKKLVWVTVGKTEHQAWLLEDVKDKNVVSIRWETTGSEERVPVLSIRHEAPDDGRRSRRRRTTVQDSLKDLDDTTIQWPRKRKRRPSQSKAATLTKKESIEKESLTGERMETEGARVESKKLKKLDGTLSALSDIKSGTTAVESSMRQNKQEIVAVRKEKVKASSIDKASLSKPATAKESAIPNKWKKATPIFASSSTYKRASSTITSSTNSSKVSLAGTPVAQSSKHEEQSNDEDHGYWM